MAVPFSLDDVPDDVTIGEVDRRVTRLENDVRERSRALDDRLANALSKMVGRDYYDERHKVLAARVGDLEAELEDERLSRANYERDRIRYHRQLIAVVVGSGLASLGAVIAALVHHL